MEPDAAEQHCSLMNNFASIEPRDMFDFVKPDDNVVQESFSFQNDGDLSPPNFSCKSSDSGQNISSSYINLTQLTVKSPNYQNAVPRADILSPPMNGNIASACHRAIIESPLLERSPSEQSSNSLSGGSTPSNASNMLSPISVDGSHTPQHIHHSTPRENDNGLTRLSNFLMLPQSGGSAGEYIIPGSFPILTTPSLLQQQQNSSIYYVDNNQTQSPASRNAIQDNANSNHASSYYINSDNYQSNTPQHSAQYPKQASSLSPVAPHSLHQNLDKSKLRELLMKKSNYAESMPRGNLLLPGNNQPPYASFEKMNLYGERNALLEGFRSVAHINLNDLDFGASHSRSSAYKNETESSMRATTANNLPQNTVSKNQNDYLNLVPSQQNMHTPNKAQISPLNPIHQQQLFQSIHLHKHALNQQDMGQNRHGLLGINCNSYSNSASIANSQSVVRNLSANYGSDVVISQDSGITQAIHQSPCMKTKAHKRPNRRWNQTTCKQSDDDILEIEYTSEEFSCDSDDSKLVIDTSSAVTSEGYKCAECPAVCRTRGALRKHLSSLHFTYEHEPFDKQYFCPIEVCKYTTCQRDQYDEHLANHISEGWTPTGKRRANKAPLQRYRYNKEEFKCYCGYRCTVEKAFNNHLAAHKSSSDGMDLNSSVKASCPICGQDRSNESSLRRHMKKHKIDRFYKCDICKFKSVQQKKLIQHRRMHTGEKPHLCPHCPYRAARRDNLRSHVKRMHKKLNMFSDTFTPRTHASLPDEMVNRSPQKKANDDYISQHQEEAHNAILTNNLNFPINSHGTQLLDRFRDMQPEGGHLSQGIRLGISIDPVTPQNITLLPQDINGFQHQGVYGEVVSSPNAK